MKHASRSLGFILLLSLCVFLTGFSSEKKELKATWLWQTSLIATEPDQILAFTKGQGVNLLYLQIDTKRKAAYYQSFIKKAGEAGIAVHALNGDPRWGLKQNQPKLLAWVDWVIAYNKSAAEEEKFSGIHLDIEPHLLPTWKKEQSSIVSQWMGNVNAYTKKAHNAGLEVGCDIPFWMDKEKLPNDSATSLTKWLISKHDSIAVMAYRDRAKGPNSITSIVPQELAFGDELDKKILIAVEAKQSSEGNIVSFSEEGKTYMNAELAKLPASLSAHPSYAGIAIHSYEYWKALKK